MEILKDILELLIYFNNLLNIFIIKLCCFLLGVFVKCVLVFFYLLVWFFWLIELLVMIGDVLFFIEFLFGFILLVLYDRFMCIF